GRPAAQPSQKQAIPIHPRPIQARRLMTHLPPSSRLKPLLELTPEVGEETALGFGNPGKP
ncbi:MAG: hypothetical protein ACREXJ_01035, partial [Gammaproteobacteria bacterium]